MNRVTPNHKVDLTAEGHKQAQAAGLVLRDFLGRQSVDNEGEERNPRSVMILRSPYNRARQTAEHLIDGIKQAPGATYSVLEDARMREQDFGNFQSTPAEMGRIWKERAHYGHFFYRIPHGESAADVYDRVSGLNESLFRYFLQPDFPNILVLVTHGVWSRVFFMKWFRWSYEQFESLRNIPHCHFLIMKRDKITCKYILKTPLKTWDDVADENADESEVESELEGEVTFNSKNKLSNPEDLDIASIIRSQKESLLGTYRTSHSKLRNKPRELKEAYFQSHRPTSPSTLLLAVDHAALSMPEPIHKHRTIQEISDNTSAASSTEDDSSM